MGHTLVAMHPDDWGNRLRGLRSIDWRRTNKEWQGVAMAGSDVVNRRQNRMDTASFLKAKLGLTLTAAEERSLKGVGSVMADLRRLVQS